MGPDAQNGAEGVLLGLKQCGVDYLFANAGTDFPPIIEALASQRLAGHLPVAVTVPHETAAVAMAHGYYLVTGKPQALMVHVNVGLANTVMGAINAASDNIPLLLMSGRTPLTEHNRLGARASPVQYGQEMYDQSALVREAVKFNYEMRYPEQGEMLVHRALSVAMSEPRGPAYLSLPREPLCEAVPEEKIPSSRMQSAAPALPDPLVIAEVAQALAEAKNPLIICQRGDNEGRLSRALSRFANAFGVAVCEPFTVRNVLASSDAMFAGGMVGSLIGDADFVLAVDALVPWIESQHQPASGAKVAHMGPDPLFRKLPVRSFQSDFAITSDPALGIIALHEAMEALPTHDVSTRRDNITAKSSARRKAMAERAAAGDGTPMSAEWLSKCLSDVLGDDGIVFTELGVVPAAMDLKGPNRLFTAPHSGGLGWALPAALGAQLADRDRLTVACVGDGSYMFANPVACHQIAEALELPLLTIVKNNGMWNAVRRATLQVYNDGEAAKANKMPLTSLEPLPDFTMVAGASRAHTERVTDGRDLPAALERAIAVIRNERRQVLLDIQVAISDTA